MQHVYRLHQRENPLVVERQPI